MSNDEKDRIPESGDRRQENSPVEATEPETAQVSTDASNAPETATGATDFLPTPPKKKKTAKKAGGERPEAGGEQPTEPTPKPTGDEPPTKQPTESTGDELPTENTVAIASGLQPTASSLPETELTPEPEVEAVLEQNQCPRCGHNVTDPKRISGKVAKYPIAGVHNGVPYQVIESRQITCDKCGQLFAVNKYI